MLSFMRGRKGVENRGKLIDGKIGGALMLCLARKTAHNLLLSAEILRVDNSHLINGHIASN